VSLWCLIDVDGWVFTAPHGGDLDYSHFRRRVWGPATVTVGLDGLEFHDLRRANATGMVLDGIDLKPPRRASDTAIRGSRWPSTRRQRVLLTPLRPSSSGRGSSNSRGLLAAWALR